MSDQAGGNRTDQNHDCIVVGAGPAGSAAALRMARDELDVVFLERDTRPGERNEMSGALVTDKLYDLVSDFCDRAPLQRRIIGGEVHPPKASGQMQHESVQMCCERP